MKNIWTTEEKEFLTLNYKYGVKHCSSILNKSKRAISEMAKKMKLQIPIKYTKEYVYNIVMSSQTQAECVIKFGLSPKASGNYQTLKKYTMLYDIDISHFKSGFQPNNVVKNKIPLSDILVKNSTYSRTALKIRLYKDGLKKKECELCGQDENWNGVKLVHILDHINGDTFDNRLENLRIVCPNCNSGLDTNCSKNKIRYKYINGENTNKKIISICGCGKSKHITAKKCLDCSKIIKRKVKNRPTHETILEDLKTMSYVAVGKKYGVSDNAIRKWLKSYSKPNHIV